MDRPVGVIILTAFSFLVALPAFVLSVFFFKYAHQEGMVALLWGFRSMNAFYIISAGLFLFGAACAVSAFALWSLLPWARGFTIALLVSFSILVEADAIFEFEPPIPLLVFLSLLALNGLVLWYFSNSRVKQAFEQT